MCIVNLRVRRSERIHNTSSYLQQLAPTPSRPHRRPQRHSKRHERAHHSKVHDVEERTIFDRVHDLAWKGLESTVDAATKIVEG